MLLNGPVVLFFYPAAMSMGCTKESCHFRDLATEFSALGAQRLGISMDEVEKQAEFTTKNNLDYPLLADVNGDVARLYGAVTLPEFRSRGCYHAVLGARLRIARDLGATIAITRGRPLTSGRLLVTSGFTVHDVETCYRLSVA